MTQSRVSTMRISGQVGSLCLASCHVLRVARVCRPRYGHCKALTALGEHHGRAWGSIARRMCFFILVFLELLSINLSLDGSTVEPKRCDFGSDSTVVTHGLSVHHDSILIQHKRIGYLRSLTLSKMRLPKRQCQKQRLRGKSRSGEEVRGVAVLVQVALAELAAMINDASPSARADARPAIVTQESSTRAHEGEQRRA
jgi:hypothetical protein